MNKKINRKGKPKYSLMDVLEDYCWVIGLSLLVAGVVSLSNDPRALLFAGIVIMAFGVILKARARK
jgi:hypothetical protein